jgi:hypothetical protein
MEFECNYKKINCGNNAVDKSGFISRTSLEAAIK